MKLTPQERADRRASFRRMNLSEKLEYLYTYYKLPILLSLLALFLLGAGLHRFLTHKDVRLYLACVNVSISDTLEQHLNAGFISSTGGDPNREEVLVNQALYLSENPAAENHQYEYASQLKIMASIASQQLDVVLMNQEAYDLLSQAGYLRDLQEFLAQDSALYQAVEPYLTTNTVILEDNSIEYNLNEADVYEAVTEEVVNGVDVTGFPLFQENGGFSGTVYFGVMADGPRLPEALAYLKYLVTA